MAITRKGNIITDTTRGQSYKQIDGKIHSLNKDGSVGKRVGFLLENSLRNRLQNKGATRRLNPSQKQAKQTAGVISAVKNLGSLSDSKKPKTRTVKEKRSGIDEALAKAKIKKAMAEGTTTSTKPRVRTKSKTNNNKTVFRESSSTTNKLAKTEAKNYNLGVSKGGVSFNEAFAHFRKKGNKTFTWNGKKYTTELKKDKK